MTGLVYMTKTGRCHTGELYNPASGTNFNFIHTAKTFILP